MENKKVNPHLFQTLFLKTVLGSSLMFWVNLEEQKLGNQSQRPNSCLKRRNLKDVLNDLGENTTYGITGIWMSKRDTKRYEKSVKTSSSLVAIEKHFQKIVAAV